MKYIVYSGYFLTFPLKLSSTCHDIVHCYAFFFGWYQTYSFSTLYRKRLLGIMDYLKVTWFDKILLMMMMISAQVVETSVTSIDKTARSFSDYTIKCQGSLSKDGDRYTVYNGCYWPKFEHYNAAESVRHTFSYLFLDTWKDYKVFNDRITEYKSKKLNI